MSFSKQDELLQKLQKCVGKLQNKTGNTQRNMRQNQRYMPVDVSRNREPKQQYNFRQNSVKPPKQLNTRTNYESNRPRWNNKNYDVEFLNQGNQDKSFSYNTAASHLQDNVTQRSYQNGQTNGRVKDQYRRKPLEQIKNKYEDQPRYSINQPSKRPKSYLQMNETQRAPLRDYDLNNTINLSHINKPNIQKRQPRRYLEQQNTFQATNQEVSTPKYQTHRKQDMPPKAQGYRRNSVSHNISQNQNFNRTAQKQDAGFYKNMDFSNRIDKYDVKDKQNSHLSAIKPFNSNMRTVSNKQQPRPKIQVLQQGYTSARDSQTRQMSLRQKTRNTGVGSISSIKRNQLDSSSINYQTFQPREQRGQRQLNLKQILDEVGNANQDTFTKLQKISELNQRINKRIKNIIQTFQNK